jgi:hypothetical protein
MNNVVPITKNKSRRMTASSLQGETAGNMRILTRETAPAAPPQTVNPLLTDVESASSDYLANKLRIQHKRARMERELAQEEADNDAALEAAAYSAFLNGVEEVEIYSLDEFAGMALENAIRKMQVNA